MIIKEVTSPDAAKTTLVVSAVLSADKGIPNEIVEFDDGFDVVADDGCVIRIHQEEEGGE